MGYQSETTMNHFKYYLMPLLYTISDKIGSLFFMRKNGMVDKNETVKEKITMDNKEKGAFMPQRMEWKTRNRCKIKSKNPRRSRDCIHPGCCRTLQSNCGR